MNSRWKPIKTLITTVLATWVSLYGCSSSQPAADHTPIRKDKKLNHPESNAANRSQYPIDSDTIGPKKARDHSEPSDRERPKQQQGNASGNIIIIGDSIFAFPLITRIDKHLKDNYGLKTFRYAENGAVMNQSNKGHIKSLPLPVQLIIDNKKIAIPNQYRNFATKQHAGKIDTVIMNGGGNDILANEAICRYQECTHIMAPVEEEVSALLEEMADDGVKNAIFVGYYPLKGSKQALSKAVAEGNRRLKKRCDDATLNCIWVDTAGTVTGNQIGADEIHPTSTGSRNIAKLIYQAYQNL